MGIVVVSACFYKSTSKVERFKKSCREHSIKPVLYGVRERFRGFVHAKIKRLQMVLKKLKEDYVVFIDCADAVFLGGLDELWEAYCELSPERKIVISGDKRCWPHRKYARRLKKRNGPDSTQPYICAGFFMGPRLELIKALSVLVDLYKNNHKLGSKLKEDDQGYWMEAVCTCKIDADIDAHGSLCLSMAHQPDDIIKGGVMSTGVKPVIIHYNGLSKHLIGHHNG